VLDDADTAAVAALNDPVRRRLYEHVRMAGRPVSREEAAERAGISRGLAAFHLDKLVERGLLVFGYARPEGRSGPGAGRPAKLYRPSGRDVSVSIPERRYDAIGRLLVDAVGERTGPAEAAALRAGRAIGQERRAPAKRMSHQRAVSTTSNVLRERGYEPSITPEGSVRLRNCPFHSLARHAPEVVCRMNRSLIEGIIDGIGVASLEAVLEPTPEECCVVLRRRRPT
jgi:predicted ArsR family transcriptional regulator